ncbi:hypothetical protein BABINDRAFT_161045 [Babjeviella inositovora NRRL Y-12698]|uniref:Large ribosomal subunit protein mL53 n=1 Tax=Babjeviella inositovora NRRL Y-12698 TaxID=984486 RepID=A0A1E3QUX6_9ASCO|nr:uncharacterized protein BABINDRAFT_161045 [Babjeviella inositovora NRRL Y-12698]ODQ80842.1 hypothetical protein BABINDRAFT_161045 [Babjeviella inositovora NRRL Y-12698]
MCWGYQSLEHFKSQRTLDNHFKIQNLISHSQHSQLRILTPVAKTARLFLNTLPSTTRGQCPVDFKILSASSAETPTIKVTFKDKNALECDPTAMSFSEAQEVFDRHSRQLKLKDDLEN